MTYAVAIRSVSNLIAFPVLKAVSLLIIGIFIIESKFHVLQVRQKLNVILNLISSTYTASIDRLFLEHMFMIGKFDAIAPVKEN